MKRTASGTVRMRILTIPDPLGIPHFERVDRTCVSCRGYWTKAALMQVNVTGDWLWQFVHMDGLVQKFLALRMVLRAPVILLGIAIVLVGAFAWPQFHTGHPTDRPVPAIGVSDLTVPVDDRYRDLTTDASCGPGIGCSAFTVPAEEVLVAVRPSKLFRRADIAGLVPRVTPPPLPPPKITILL